MKLHTVHGVLTVPNAVNFVRVSGGAGDDLEGIGQSFLLHDERVVAHHLQWRRQAGEHALAVVLDGRCLAVHHSLSANDAATVCFTDCLVAEANAENGDSASPTANGLYGDACLRRSARSG